MLISFDKCQLLSPGYLQHNGAHISRANSLNNAEHVSSKTTRRRSKSAVTLSQSAVKVNEIVPAVPPRRASLGILHRTNSNLTKFGLRGLKESNSNSSERLMEGGKFKPIHNEGRGFCSKVSESEENLDERTYMVLEPEPGHEYAVPNKSKFYVSAEKEGESKPVVRMTMRERLKQLTQSSEDEIDHTSDNELSPAADKRKSDLANELMNSSECTKQKEDCNTGQVVTVKFNTDSGMLSAEGAEVTGAGEAFGDNTESDNSLNVNKSDSKAEQPGKEQRFKMQPGKDAQGYTKLLHMDESEKVNSTFISYVPLDSSRSASDSGTSCNTPVRASWVSQSIYDANIAVTSAIDVLSNYRT